MESFYSQLPWDTAWKQSIQFSALFIHASLYILLNQVKKISSWLLIVLGHFMYM